MTDRIKGFIVTLDKDIREDDIDEIVTALKMVKRVADVTPMKSEFVDQQARARVRVEIRDKFYEFMTEVMKKLNLE